MRALHELHSSMPERKGFRANLAVRPLLLAMLLYVSLAVGNVFYPILFNNERQAMSILVFIALLVPLYTSPTYWNTLPPILTVLALPMLGLLTTTFATRDPYLAFLKFDASFISAVYAALIGGYLLARFGEVKTLACMIAAALIILVMTIAYKLNFGFADRGVRFFLNGPIVFGWMMGFMGIICLYLFVRKGWGSHILVLYGCFAFALLWTQSKGPLVAFAVTSALLLLSKLSTRNFVAMVTAAIILPILAIQLIPAEYVGRLDAIWRIVNSETNDIDAGSVHSREEMWFEARNMFLESPYFGIGYSNYKYFTSIDTEYPHNFILEILSETGAVGGMAIGGLLIVLFYGTGALSRYLMIFFSIALLFSGSSAYLRLLLFWPLAEWGYLGARKIFERKQRLALKRRGQLETIKPFRQNSAQWRGQFQNPRGN